MKNKSSVVVGQVVRVIQGRDQGTFGIVIDQLDNHFVFIADGYRRRFENPKKKNLLHVEPIDYIAEEVQQTLKGTGRVNNSKIRFALDKFKESFITEEQMKGEK